MSTTPQASVLLIGFNDIGQFDLSDQDSRCSLTQLPTPHIEHIHPAMGINLYSDKSHTNIFIAGSATSEYPNISSNLSPMRYFQDNSISIKSITLHHN